MRRLSAPEFWARPSLGARLLLPFSWAYAAAAGARRGLTRPWRPPVPVVCIGNLVAGGAGKTPVALDLVTRLTAAGWHPHLLSRGYGGSAAGPVHVDPIRHGAAEVGDEPLLLAGAAPTWVARDRTAGARAAIAAGADLLVLDDGFQNPGVAKDLSLLVVDAGYGFGNRQVLPAGPLREPIGAGLARADAVVLLGPSGGDALRLPGGKPLLRAHLAPVAAGDLAGKDVVAFAGIGRPAKFFATLEAIGARLVARHAFPDHYPYPPPELARLADQAAAQGAQLVTTAKDAVRLPSPWRERVRVVEVRVAWEDEPALLVLLARLADHRRG